MQKYLILSIVVLVFGCQQSEDKVEPEKQPKAASELEVQIVEASCGQCQFDMEGTSCDLAVRINGKAYFVDGTDINDHGDAHGDAGFCTTIRLASVQGKIESERFVVASFELLPEENE